MGRGAGRGRMNRLCTLHGRPSFSEPRPTPPLAGAFHPHRGGGGPLHGALLWAVTVTWWGRCRSPTVPLPVVHGSSHYGWLPGLQGLFHRCN